MTTEEFIDFYTENSFAVRDAEVQFKLQIGELLASETDLEPFAKVIKKHKSFLIECIEVYKQWPEIEKQYTKEKSWSDLVKLAGIEKEKRTRKPLKKLIEERKKIYEAEMADPQIDKVTIKDQIKGRLDEDTELLKEDKCES